MPAASLMHYEPLPNSRDDQVNTSDTETEAEGGEHLEENNEENELEPLVHPRDRAPSTPKSLASHILSGFFRQGEAIHSHRRPSFALPTIAIAPVTPASSDGVFTNIPAKPSSSRDRNKEDEDLGEDEWIFMTPEQRKKLAPPKYSKIKRDRSPQYATEYTPPVVSFSGGRLHKSSRLRALRPRINTLPAGPSRFFVAAAAASTLLPFLGLLLVHLAGRRGCGGRWRSHAARLGAQAGFGLGLLHVGAMLLYVPALLAAAGVGASPVSPLLGLALVVVVLPFTGRIVRNAAREYTWVKAQERVLIDRILQADLGVTVDDGADEDEGGEDVEAGRRYIQGTDIRVRDLKKILAKARDARLARSLRAAGF